MKNNKNSKKTTITKNFNKINKKELAKLVGGGGGDPIGNFNFKVEIV